MKEQVKQWAKNLICNILWVASAIMWYEVQYWKPEYYRRSVYAATIAAILVAAFCGSMWEKVRSASKGIWLLAGVTALGTVIFPIKFLNASVWQSVASGWFVFSLLVIFYKYLYRVLGDLFKDVEKIEWVIFAGVALVYLVFLVFSFSKSQAFYATKHTGDTVYTADSMQLVQKNVYLQLLHVENDLRQPLFAVTAIPFMGLAYLLSLLVAPIPHASIICMGTAQMLLLLVTLFMFAKMVTKDKKDRVFFFMLLCLMYPSILFSIMMEQYIVAVFWVALYMYALIVKKQKDGVALIGATGSLLTSAAVVVFSEETDEFDWKKYLLNIVEIAAKGVFAIVFFCRMDVISTIVDKIESLKKFSGESVLMKDKILQYIAFVKACFIAPAAGENWTSFKRPTWQLYEVETVSIVGVLLIVMAIAGFWMGRKQLLHKICGFWILHSIVILIMLGWGTAENGLILYGLYYGWAYWILVYNFISHWLNKCAPKVKYVLWGMILLLLAAINGKGMLELLIFVRTHYPA